MQTFEFVRPGVAGRAHSAWRDGDAFIAGGTDLLQLMKANVVTPGRLIDLDSFLPHHIAVTDHALELDPLCTMAHVAAHREVMNGWPALTRALLLSASPQVRNMGTVGGNLLQRTRCGYYRDTGFPCNKRHPGSGCPAVHGHNHDLGIFGVSAHCIATHPSDMPVALMALDAELDLTDQNGTARRLKLADFYRLPGDTPHIETVLQPGELITKVRVPATPLARNSHYFKVRDRASFAFALVSAAVGLDVRDGIIRDARVVLGGVAPMPWRLSRVEDALRGQHLEPEVLEAASGLAGDGATGAGGNDFKIELARRVVLRTLRGVADRESL